jgi:predicted choloylglycine hydrolase
MLNQTSPGGMPVVILSGTPFQRGFQHGCRFSDRITQSILTLKSDNTPHAYQAARDNALQSWARLQRHAAPIAEEIFGIASGASCDPIDVYCHIGFEFFEGPPATGCSGLAFASPKGAIVGQNWDAPPEMRPDLALFLHIGEAGFELAMVASVGTLGWVGQNQFGLALLTNDVMLDTVTEGFPSQVARRLLLAEADVASAVARLKTLPIMAGRSYLLGDRAGSITALELSPECGVCELPKASRLAHTNHALLPATRAFEDESRLQAVYPSSRMRLEALEKVGVAAESVDDFMHALSDRANAPNAVSKTVSAQEYTVTAFSVIFDCGERVIYLCDGPPAAGTYRRFHWPDPIAVPRQPADLADINPAKLAGV